MSAQTHRGPTVRTYRGRSLEELIPRIRAELGPDAIILREREGLTGGVGGFFAQRCVEVDAQAPAAIDFYDEEEEALPGDTPWPQQPRPTRGPTPTPWPERPAAQTTAPAPEPAPEPEPEPEPEAAPEVGAQAQPAPESEPGVPHSGTPTGIGASRFHDREMSFAQRLALARQEHAAHAGTAHPAPTPVATTPTPSLPAQAPAAGAEPSAVRPAQGAGRPAQGAGQLDAASAGAIARELTARGISEAWARELIVAAAAHLTPFMAGGDLRAAVRDGLAASIAAPAPLPSSGAAVAFVGAGGSGKSRCTAALAAAYARASTLRVGVVALHRGSRGDDVAELLDGQGVPVTPGDGNLAAGAVLAGRERGLVVLDTPGVSPVDGPGVDALARALGELALDAVYVTVPATLSATAARNLLDGLAPLSPTALAITHADETDALGIATELAFLSGLPIAFVHGGTTLDGSLQRTDPRTVAARILP